MNLYESFKNSLKENEWEDALKSGKIINLAHKPNAPADFKYADDKVYYRSGPLTGRTWAEHPNDLKSILKHFDKQSKDGATLTVMDDESGSDLDMGKLIDNDMTIKEIDDTAQWLYDNNIDEWEKFTDNELKELVNLVGVYGRAYDDEVYDELARRDLKFESEKTDKIEKEIKEYKKVLKGDIPGVERDKYEAKLSNAKKKLKAAKDIKEGEEELQGSKVYYKSLKRMIDDLDRKIEKANEQEGQRLIEQRAKLMDKLTKLEDAYGDKLNEAETKGTKYYAIFNDNHKVESPLCFVGNPRYFSRLVDHFDGDLFEYKLGLNSQDDVAKSLKTYFKRMKKNWDKPLPGNLRYKIAKVDYDKDNPQLEEVTDWLYLNESTELNEAEEQNVVKSFKDDENGLRVDVVKAPNGKFFNYYYSIDKDHWDSNAGPFNSEEEAIKMAKKHRPTVKESQTQEIEGIMKDLRKDIPDIDKYMEEYYVEIAKEEPKPAYDKEKDEMNPEWEKWDREKSNVLYSEVAWNNFTKWVKDKYGKDINESENLKEAVEQKYRKSNPDYNSFLRDVKKYTGSYDYLYGGKINAELYGQPIAVNYFYWNRPYVGGGNNLEVNVLTPMDALWGDSVQEAIDNGFERNSKTRLSNAEIKKKILEIISSLDKENLDEAELKEDAVDNARADTAMSGVAYDDYQVNFGDKGGDSPMGLFGQVLDKLTELGWSYEMDDKDTEIGIENYSPAGEDLYDYLSYGSNDLSDDEKGKNLIDSIQELAQNFDADEHVEMYVDMRGQRGVPDSIRTLVEDADAIQEMYDELAKEVEALRKGSMNESEKKFWTFKA